MVDNANSGAGATSRRAASIAPSDVRPQSPPDAEATAAKVKLVLQRQITAGFFVYLVLLTISYRQSHDSFIGGAGLLFFAGLLTLVRYLILSRTGCCSGDTSSELKGDWLLITDLALIGLLFGMPFIHVALIVLIWSTLTISLC